MKVFITASSGVGKTAVTDELSKRGYTTFDADDRTLKLTSLVITATGEPADWPKGYIDWSFYSWNASEEKLGQLLASDETVFLSGFLGNQENLYKHFDKLIALSIDPKEHQLRLHARPKRDVGDDEQNIQRRLDKYASHMEKFINSGFIVIDNSGPISDTADEILRAIDEH